MHNSNISKITFLPLNWLSQRSLRYSARRESMMMPAFEVSDNLPSLDSKPVDSVSIMYAQSLGLDIWTPIEVKTAGNCLFNSISTLLYGHEEKAIELRSMTCLQMCNNKGRYLSSADASDTMSLSPPFEEASTAGATDASWSSAWNLILWPYLTSYEFL